MLIIRSKRAMHPAGYQYSNGSIKGSDFAVRPRRTAPTCSSLAKTRVPPA